MSHTCQITFNVYTNNHYNNDNNKYNDVIITNSNNSDTNIYSYICFIYRDK